MRQLKIIKQIMAIDELLEHPEIATLLNNKIVRVEKIDNFRFTIFLTTRESDVLQLYFGLNNNTAMTLEEIGERYNLTRERVRQIKEKATRRLRHASRSKTLKAYLG